MAYTDLTAVYAYKDIVQWRYLDAHAENQDLIHTTLVNYEFYVTAGVQSQSENFQKVNFDTTVFDPESKFALANDRFSPGRTGRYLFTGVATIETTGSGERTAIALYKNGTEFKRGNDMRDRTVTNAAYQSVSLHALVNVTSSLDYFEMWTDLTTGITARQLLSAHFFAVRLGD